MAVVMKAELPGLTQQEMNRLFESFLGQGRGHMQPAERTWAPPMDVCETQTELRVLPDGVRASYRDGVLEIRLPKRPEATPRIISVEAA